MNLGWTVALGPEQTPLSVGADLDNSFLCHSNMYNNITECDVQLDFKTEHKQVADSFCITAK